MKIVDVSGMSVADAKKLLDNLYRENRSENWGRTAPPSHLYSSLIDLHVKLSETPESEKKLRSVDSDLWWDAYQLRKKKQQFVAIFMDILIDNCYVGDFLFYKGDLCFLSVHSSKIFVEINVLEARVDHILKCCHTKPLVKREKEMIETLVEGFGLQEDYTNSWLSRANSSFWHDVVKSRTDDAFATLKALFCFIDPEEISKTLQSITRKETKRDFLEMCFKLETIDSEAKLLLTEDRKIPVSEMVVLNNLTKPLVEKVPSIANKFVFIRGV